MNKIYLFFLQLSLVFIGIFITYSAVQAQSYDDCTDAYDIADLISNMEYEDVVTSIQFDNTNATGGEDTNPANIGCLDNEGLQHSLWYTFIGDGHSYEIGTTACGVSDDEYLNTSQALIYKGSCGNLEFISCNRGQQSITVVEDRDFTFKALLSTEVGVPYYILIDGGDYFDLPEFNLTGKFCLALKRLTPVNCGDDNLKLTFELYEEADNYLCSSEFSLADITEKVVPFGVEDPDKYSGFVFVESSVDHTNIAIPVDDGSVTNYVYAGDITTDKFVNLFNYFGFENDSVYFRWYYYYNAPLLESSISRPDLSQAECIVASNQVVMYAIAENSVPEVSSAQITDSSSDEGNGAISLVTSNGSGNYEYLWSHGASGASITDLEPGEYTVTITDLAFCSPPIVETYIVGELTSTSDFSIDGSILSMYPNPSDGQFYITTDRDLGQIQITIYTMTGKELYNKNEILNESSEIRIDLSAPEGFYILKVSNGESISTQKFIIRKS